MHLCKQRALGMRRIQGEDAPFDHLWRQQRLERADLIHFLLNIAVSQDDVGGYLITTELMDWMGLRTGSPKCFAINRQMGVIRLAAAFANGWVLLRTGAALPIAQKTLPRSRQVAWHPLSPARCSTSSSTACAFGAVQSVLPEKRRDAESILSRHSNSFVLPVSPRQAGRGSAPIRSVSLIRPGDQTAFARLHGAKPRQPVRAPFPNRLVCSMLYSPCRVFLVGLVFFW